MSVSKLLTILEVLVARADLNRGPLRVKVVLSSLIYTNLQNCLIKTPLPVLHPLLRFFGLHPLVGHLWDKDNWIINQKDFKKLFRTASYQIADLSAHRLPEFLQAR